MCLTIPGKVIEIYENRFVIDYENEKRVVEMCVIDDLKIGDYVIVTNKIIINRVPKEEAVKYLEILNESREKNGNKL
jgi:hydrogenase assembly chaperone HypC/HupF